MDLQQPQHRQREQQCKYIFKLTRDHTLRLLPLAGRISLAFPSCCTCVTVCVCGPETSVRVPSDTPMYPWRTRRKRGRLGCLPTVLVRCVLVCRFVTVQSFSLFFSSLFPSSLLLFFVFSSYPLPLIIDAHLQPNKKVNGPKESTTKGGTHTPNIHHTHTHIPLIQTCLTSVRNAYITMGACVVVCLSALCPVPCAIRIRTTNGTHPPHRHT